MALIDWREITAGPIVAQIPATFSLFPATLPVPTCSLPSLTIFSSSSAPSLQRFPLLGSGNRVYIASPGSHAPSRSPVTPHLSDLASCPITVAGTEIQLFLSHGTEGYVHVFTLRVRLL